MAETATLAQSPADSQNGSLGTEKPFDFNDLAPAEVAPDLAPASAKPDVEPGTCATCGDAIVREPGARGRMPKYHPDCRPTKSTSTTPRVGGRSDKVEKEATQALAAFEGMVVKAAIMLSMVDRYDAFCLMVGWSQVKPNLFEVLKRYAPFRKEMLAIQTGGSILGLILSVIMILAPIAAHHGLIPGKHIAQILVNAPFTLHKIQQKLAEGTAGLTALMEEQLAAVKEAKESAHKAATVTDATPEQTARVNGHGRV